MAITPRTFFRNPVLLFILTLLAIPAAALFFCSGSCPSQKAVKADVQPTRTIVTVQKEAPVKEVNENGPGWLGVEIQTLNAKRAKFAGVQPTAGVLILDVLRHMPAETSGFRAYDVVTHFDGVRLTNACALKRRVMKSKPGTRVPVRVIRDGSPVMLYPTLGSK